MTKTVLQKPKHKPLSEQVRKAMKKYFATLGDTNPANVYKMVMAEVEPELLKAVMKYANNNQSKAATCLLYTSPSPRDGLLPRMPSSA